MFVISYNLQCGHVGACCSPRLVGSLGGYFTASVHRLTRVSPTPHHCVDYGVEWLDVAMILTLADHYDDEGGMQWLRHSVRRDGRRGEVQLEKCRTRPREACRRSNWLSRACTPTLDRAVMNGDVTSIIASGLISRRTTPLETLNGKGSKTMLRARHRPIPYLALMSL